MGKTCPDTRNTKVKEKKTKTNDSVRSKMFIYVDRDLPFHTSSAEPLGKKLGLGNTVGVLLASSVFHFFRPAYTAYRAFIMCSLSGCTIMPQFFRVPDFETWLKDRGSS